jgi:hypothetical protein
MPEDLTDTVFVISSLSSIAVFAHPTANSTANIASAINVHFMYLFMLIPPNLFGDQQTSERSERGAKNRRFLSTEGSRCLQNLI